MPLSFIPAIFAIDKLAYRLGRLLGTGAAIAAGRDTPSYSRPVSTTAWLGRCALSLAILASTYGILSWLSPRMDTIPSLMGSWLALLLLPRTTPRLFLMIARLFAMATSISVLGSSWTWAVKRWPQVDSFEGIFLAGWWGLAFAMLVWALVALRRRPRPNYALVPVIPRPVVDCRQPVLEGFESVAAETSHTHLNASFDWATRSARLTISAQVRTEKLVLSASPTRRA